MNLDEALKVRRVVNGAGYLTVYGAAQVDPLVVEAVSSVLRSSVVMDELHDRACRMIASATGAEAGFVTACAAAGITVSVAAAMTGTSEARVVRLPDTTGMKDEVILIAGHDCDFGARISQMVRLAGGKPAVVGNMSNCGLGEIKRTLSDRTAAALYVVSDHVDPRSGPTLEAFCSLMKVHQVPVIVDCAAQDDLRGFLARGADAVIYSAHKVREGLTAGIVAGSADFIAACRLQDYGIGRTMKVGKEGVAGAIAALWRWQDIDHGAIQASRRARTELIADRLGRVDGLAVDIEDDRDGNPVRRVRFGPFGENSQAVASALRDSLAAADPVIALRTVDDDPSAFSIDPRSLTDGEAEYLTDRIVEAFAQLSA